MARVNQQQRKEAPKEQNATGTTQAPSATQTGVKDHVEVDTDQNAVSEPPDPSSDEAQQAPETTDEHNQAAVSLQPTLEPASLQDQGQQTAGVHQSEDEAQPQQRVEPIDEVPANEESTASAEEESSTEEENAPAEANEFIKSIIARLMEQSGTLTRRVIDILDKDICSYIMAHIADYPQEGLQKHIQGRLNYLSDPVHEARYSMLLKNPETIRKKDASKYKALMILRGAYGAEIGEGRAEQIHDENKQFMTQSKFGIKSCKLTRRGRALVSWAETFNDISTIITLSDEDLDVVEGMKGYPGYKKRAILFYAYDISRGKDSHELDNYIRGINNFLPKEERETNATTATPLRKFVTDWWKDNAVKEKDNGTGEIIEQQATEIQQHVHVAYVPYLAIGSTFMEEFRELPEPKLWVQYSLSSPNSPENLENGEVFLNEAKSKEDIEHAIREHILDHSIYTDQDTELDFECRIPQTIELVEHPKFYFKYSVSEDGQVEISYEIWKDHIKIDCFDPEETKKKILEFINNTYPVQERFKIILICDHNDRLVPRNLLDKNINTQDYKE